jgi:hypothetical protein
MNYSEGCKVEFSLEDQNPVQKENITTSPSFCAFLLIYIDRLAILQRDIYIKNESAGYP